MIEDKLLHDERVRLECVAQAVARSMGRPTSIEGLLKDASEIEKFVLTGKQ